MGLVLLLFSCGAGQELLVRIWRVRRPRRIAVLVIAAWLLCVVGLVMSLWAFASAILLDAPVLWTVAQGVLGWTLWPSLLGCPLVFRLVRASAGLSDVGDAG